ncbi:MAG TPA: hypothetical protein PLB63_12215 [Planctomycetota bacterium]|nr:hypothetical protein [Planctomycetota bacterium]
MFLFLDLVVFNCYSGEIFFAGVKFIFSVCFVCSVVLYFVVYSGVYSGAWLICDLLWGLLWGVVNL